ncbi:MAG: type II toxin-antitoxin system VapC family toxin [Terracidiphilus sp.]
MTAAEPDRLLWLLLDTHTLLWMVEDHPRLGAETARTLNRAAREERIAVSAITPWEIGVLVAKKRIDLHRDLMEWVRSALSRPGISVVPLEPEIAVACTHLPFEMHPDPADRILVATARHLGATLVTADQALLELARKGNFRALDAGK